MTKCADAAFGEEYFSETGFYVHKNPRTRKLNTFSLSMQWTIYIVVQTAPILNAGARAGTPPAC